MIGTVGGWLKDAALALNESGADSPGRDAQLILRKVLSIDELQLIANGARIMEPDEQLHANALLNRRLSGEPIAYIVGHKEFYGHKLSVDERVLIPRTETEELVSWLLKNIKSKSSSVIDVGTGSGAIAIALKHSQPKLNVTASDVSEKALEVARSNAEDLGVEINFEKRSLLTGQIKEFDVIAANLPYIDKKQTLSKEVSREPKEALFADAEGMGLYRTLFKQVAKYEKLPLMAIEHDPVQLLEVQNLAKGTGFEHVRVSDFISGLRPR